MPPPNTTPATAISVSNSYTQSGINLTGVPNDPNVPLGEGAAPAVWYTYVPLLNETVLGWSAIDSGDNDAAVAVWTGTPGSLTQIPFAFNIQTASGGAAFLQFNMTAGTRYYLQALNYGSPIVPMSVSTTAAPNAIAPIGSPLILSDVPGFPASFLNASTGAVLLSVGIPASEQGDVLPGGPYCFLAMGASSPFNGVSWNLYSSQMALVTSVTTGIIAGQDRFSPVRSNGSNLFYVCATKGSTNAFVQTLTATGTIGGTTWTLPSNSQDTNCMAPSADNSTLWYGQNTGGGHGIVHTYNLLTSSAGTDLVDLGASTALGYDICVLATSGNVLFPYKNTSTGSWTAAQYTTAGALVKTYSMGVQAGGVIPRIALGTDNPTSFWTKTFPDLTHVTYTHLNVSTGATIGSFTVLWNEGAGNANTSTFGPAQTCPLVLAQVLVNPPTINPANPPPTPANPPGSPTGPGLPSVARVQRRYRRFALPFEGNLYHFLERLEVLVQSGQGLSSGTFTNPVLMLRISRDGGLHWGNEIQLQTGALGQFNYRAYVNRLGRGRNFVVEIADTDPVFSSLLACYIDYSQGSS